MNEPNQSTMLKTTAPPAVDTAVNDHFVLTTANIVIGTLGILGHGVVIAVYSLNPRMTRHPAGMFLLHQSVIDILSACVFLLIRLDKWRPLLVSGSIAGISCRLWYSEYILWVSVMTSSLNLLLVSLERYASVIHPTFHRNHFTRRRAKLGMLAAWGFGLAYQSYWAVVSTAVDGKCEPVWPSDTLQTILGVTTFLVEYLIPIVLMTFAYASIIVRLNRRSTISVLYEARRAHGTIGPSNDPLPVTISAGTGNQRNSMYSQAKRNVIKTLSLVFVTYVICWTPTEIEYLVYNLGGQLDFQGPFHRATVFLVLCSICVNPFIYTAKHREFQTNLKSIVDRCGDKLRRLFTSSKAERVETYRLAVRKSESSSGQCHQAENRAVLIGSSDG